MKNIHVLPTDKPSRIIKNQDNDFILLNTYAPNWFEINLKTTKQNIYITSDEEIKGGDWCYHPLLKWGSVIKSKYDEPNSTMKKIILTTDQDLIKDGVQAIDDEFLEWFVKNPSCEEVEVNYENYKKGVGLMTSTWRISEDDYYKIIIPKEEPKQCDICKRYPRLEGTNKCESCYSVVRHVLEQDPRFKDTLLPDLRKEQETSSVGVGNQIFKIVLDEKWIPNKVSMIETDNNSVLNKQETLEEITEQIQNECHSFVESVPNVNYQDATNTFLFMKLAELTLKLKNYETRS